MLFITISTGSLLTSGRLTSARLHRQQAAKHQQEIVDRRRKSVEAEVSGSGG